MLQEAGRRRMMMMMMMMMRIDLREGRPAT
jgi:hypothetical protein